MFLSTTGLSKVQKPSIRAINIELWFTPPYTPEFNPIKRVWSFMKSMLQFDLGWI
ncbi:transposase [bacterium]|nr:transposase [bacterium]MBU1994155.1 transposase [bacterium]